MDPQTILGSSVRNLSNFMCRILLFTNIGKIFTNLYKKIYTGECFCAMTLILCFLRVPQPVSMYILSMFAYVSYGGQKLINLSTYFWGNGMMCEKKT